MSEQIREILLLLPIFLLSLSVHEFAHGWVAFKRGDDTARRMGRLTLNPVAHADLFGTILLPMMGIYWNLPIFGWAKPVPVNGANLKNPLRDMALVAAAGPASNVILALMFTVLLNFVVGGSLDDGVASSLGRFCVLGIHINVMLTIFNLLPLPPLDGFRIVQGVVSLNAAIQLEKIERFGLFLLMILFFSGGVRYLAMPIVYFSNLLIGFALGMK